MPIWTLDVNDNVMVYEPRKHLKRSFVPGCGNPLNLVKFSIAGMGDPLTGEGEL